MSGAGEVTMTVHSAEGGVRGVFTGTPEAIAGNLEDGQAAAKGAHLGKRINPDTGKPNKLLVLKPKIAGNVVSNLPEGTRVEFEDGSEPEFIEADGALQLVVDFPERVRLLLVHPIYEPLEIEVDCA